MFKTFAVHCNSIDSDMNQDFSAIGCFQTISMTSSKSNRHFSISRCIHYTFTWFDGKTLSHSTAREYRIIHIAQSYCLTNDWRNNRFILESSRYITSCFFFDQFFSFSFFSYSFFIFKTKHIRQSKSKCK